MHFSNQVKHDSPDNDSSVMFRDSCISELPTQASFDVPSRSVIQVPPDINSDNRDDGEDDSDEPPVKRVYTETNANGSSGISKLVEFCSKDIKYVASLVFWVSQLKTHCHLLSDVILCCCKNVTKFLKSLLTYVISVTTRPTQENAFYRLFALAVLVYLLCFYFSSQLSHTNVQVKLEPQEEGDLDLSDLS